MRLLVLGVARQVDDLHAVAQRLRNGIEHVRSADKEHLGQIERNIQVVVPERVVLLRIQRFQQRRRRVAAEVASQLVDLVQHKDRIVGLRAAQRLHDLPRQGPDVGAAMAANLGFVVHAAERDTLELASQGARNAAAERGLAYAWRSDEAEDGPLHIRLETAHAQVVEDAILHPLQIVMIQVENLLRLGDVHFAAGRLGPRQHRQPLDVIARERVVGGHGRHPREPVELLGGFLLHLGRHACGFDLLPQLLDILLALVQLADFLLDGFQLFAQVVIALRLLHLVLDFGLDLVAQLLDFGFLGQMLVDALHAQHHVGRFQQFLLVGGGQERQRGSNEVDQAPGIFNIERDGLQLVGEGRRSGDDLLELGNHIPLQRFQFGALARIHFRQMIDRRHHEWLKLSKFSQLDPLRALGKDKKALVGHFDDFVHRRQGAYGIQVAGLRTVHAFVALRDHHNGLLLSQGLNELNGALPADGQRQNGMGKQNRAANGQNGQDPALRAALLPPSGIGWIDDA